MQCLQATGYIHQILGNDLSHREIFWHRDFFPISNTLCHLLIKNPGGIYMSLSREAK